MNITLVDFRNNPDLRRAMEAAARQDRSRHIGSLIGSALAALLATREHAHAARPHLARQG